jgi:hypothetical protein
MTKSEDDTPVQGDETEPLEEGDKQDAADVPVKGDATEALPLSDERNDSGLLLSDD